MYILETQSSRTRRIGIIPVRYGYILDTILTGYTYWYFPGTVMPNSTYSYVSLIPVYDHHILYVVYMMFICRDHKYQWDLMIVHYSHTPYVTLVPRGRRLPLIMHSLKTLSAMHV